MSSPPVISLQQVDKCFASGLLALQGVSRSVLQGESVSLLGPSGCGKGTVLRLVAGLEAASAGRVEAPATRSGETTSEAQTAFVSRNRR